MRSKERAGSVFFLSLHAQVLTPEVSLVLVREKERIATVVARYLLTGFIGTTKAECVRSQLMRREGVYTSVRSLLRHYSIHGQKAQGSQANENGDVEQRHYRLEQGSIRLSCCTVAGTFRRARLISLFLTELFARMNTGRWECFLKEVAKLRSLPQQRLDTVRRGRVRVSPGSLVTVHRNYYYSVHSRLIGEMVEARVLPDTVDIWYADRELELVSIVFFGIPR